MRQQFIAASFLIFGFGAAQAAEVRAKELYYTPVKDAGAPKLGAVVASEIVTRAPQKKVSTPNTGLKCWIEALTNTGEWRKASPSKQFHSGERIRVHIESNVDGRLSIIQKQDDGSPEVLFPHKAIRAGDDKVMALKDTVIPLRFDQDPGKIRLFILLRKEDPTDNTPDESAPVLMAKAEAITRSKGLQVDVEEAGPEPALFAVRPASGTRPERTVAAEMVLNHRRNEPVSK